MSEFQWRSRLKSWPMWVSLATLVGVAIKTVTGEDYIPVINELITYIGPVVIALGIVNNPNNPDGI